MRHVALTLALLILSACGQGFKARHYIDPALYHYVQEFEKEYGVEVKYDVMLDDLEGNVVGKCLYGNGERMVLVDSEWLLENGDDHWRVHQLVFHELGHCSLYLDHNSGKNSDHMPVSTMYPYVFGGEYYGEHVEYYNNSLRDHRAVPLGAEKTLGCVAEKFTSFSKRGIKFSRASR